MLRINIKYFTYAICVLATASCLSVSAPTKPSAIVEWITPMKHDFGAIPQGKPVQHVFTYKNISDRPIQLEIVRTTCGCTDPTWTHEPVPPGQTATLTIEYDAYKSGRFKKKIQVYFDKQRKSENLVIVGDVE